MKEITVVAPNKVGVLAGMAEALGNSGINIASISAEGFGESAVIRLMTNDDTSALKVLVKYASGKKEKFEITLNDAIVVTLENRPGELSKLLKKVAKNGINLQGLYILAQKNGLTDVAITPENVNAALEMLNREGVKVKL